MVCTALCCTASEITESLHVFSYPILEHSIHSIIKDTSVIYISQRNVSDSEGKKKLIYFTRSYFILCMIIIEFHG